MSNIVFNRDITQICLQRSRRQLLTTPANRLELQSSPYLQYTAGELDMRRKVEILKYEANQSNSKTNKFTRAERFSQLIGGSVQRRTYSNQILQEIIDKKTVCSLNDASRPTPTSSCDVPGPVILLYEDPAIPLYNYKTNVDAYSVFVPTANDTYWTTFFNHTQFIPAVSLNFFTLYIENNVPRPNTVFSFNTPIGLSIFNPNNTSTTTETITAQISAVYVSVYYNAILMATNDPANAATTPVSFTTPVSNISGLVNLTTTTTAGVDYEATLYSGNLSITNIALPTQVGFIYDVFLRFVATTTTTDQTQQSTVITTNLSPAVLSQSVGCNIVGLPSSSVNAGFSLVG